MGNNNLNWIANFTGALLMTFCEMSTSVASIGMLFSPWLSFAALMPCWT